MLGLAAEVAPALMYTLLPTELCLTRMSTSPPSELSEAPASMSMFPDVMP